MAIGLICGAQAAAVSIATVSIAAVYLSETEGTCTERWLKRREKDPLYL